MRLQGRRRHCTRGSFKFELLSTSRPSCHLLEDRAASEQTRPDRGKRRYSQPRRPSAKSHDVLASCGSPIETPSALTVAIWNWVCATILSIQSRANRTWGGKVGARTDLVETARVAVEQHPHRVLENLARLVLCQVLVAVRAEVVERFAQEGLREVHAEAGRDRGRRVRDAEQVDVGEEAIDRGSRVRSRA